MILCLQVTVVHSKPTTCVRNYPQERPTTTYNDQQKDWQRSKQSCKYQLDYNYQLIVWKNMFKNKAEHDFFESFWVVVAFTFFSIVSMV